MKKRITIEQNVITGETTVDNDSEMTYIELVAILEYAKMMLTKDWLEAESSR